jgi:hypothetical protein
MRLHKVLGLGTAIEGGRIFDRGQDKSDGEQTNLPLAVLQSLKRIFLTTPMSSQTHCQIEILIFLSCTENESAVASRPFAGDG